MTSTNTIREILVATGSKFSKKEFCERQPGCSNNNCSASGRFQKACWSAMLFEILPEIVGPVTPGNYVWDVMPARHFIRVCMGPTPDAPAKEECIDPYFFLQTTQFN